MTTTTGKQVVEVRVTAGRLGKYTADVGGAAFTTRRVLSVTRRVARFSVIDTRDDGAHADETRAGAAEQRPTRPFRGTPCGTRWRGYSCQRESSRHGLRRVLRRGSLNRTGMPEYAPNHQYLTSRSCRSRPRNARRTSTEVRTARSPTPKSQFGR